MNRRQNFQTIAWFNDLFRRELLDLDPPYQRRSVWTQSFRDYFIETILLDYPAPTIFLYEEINERGVPMYHVVDGKQRLTTLFSFISNEFSVNENSVLTEMRGKYFQEFSKEEKNKFWSYSFSVEYLPTKDESTINNIFDRINRNVAKLTSQELRHAKYSGDFITSAEELTEWMFKKLPENFPRIAKRSKSQMKDVEFTAQILLRLEGSPRGYNTIELDEEFGKREDVWEEREDTEESFKEIIKIIIQILKEDNDNILIRSRLKNQADFYSLIGAIHSLNQQDALDDINVLSERLIDFIQIAPDANDNLPEDIVSYFEYARVASNRTLARKERERILTEVLSGNLVVEE